MACGFPQAIFCYEWSDPLGFTMTEDDRKLRDYARAILDQKKARKQARKLEEEL